VPPAVQKAVKDARKNMCDITLKGDTIPHEIIGRYGAARVFLKPACPGTGVIAGAAVRAVVEGVGIKNILTKVYGSTNPVNLTKATLNGLQRLRGKDQVKSLRGVEIR
jgi:small subunit ribosomal protein S5